MAPDRQTIMETNRSLRTIKNELENLLEKGVLDDDTYENIHSLLPAEAPLRGAARANATPSQSSNPTSPPPTEAMANMNIQPRSNNSPAPAPGPPSYSQTTGSGPPPPGPPAPPSKPVLAHVRALYRYNAADARDLSFERDDKITVHEYMNADWWMGRNTRTGAEGIFPKNYVAVEAQPPPPLQQLWPPPQQQQPGYGQPGYPPPQPQYAQPPGPPGQHNPYNSDTPPMAMANQGSSTEQQQQQEGQEGGKDGAGKAKEYGEKFGKKLGNAAIFGAGATLGGNLVNSIF